MIFQKRPLIKEIVALNLFKDPKGASYCKLDVKITKICIDMYNLRIIIETLIIYGIFAPISDWRLLFFWVLVEILAFWAPLSGTPLALVLRTWSLTPLLAALDHQW